MVDAMDVTRRSSDEMDIETTEPQPPFFRLLDLPTELWIKVCEYDVIEREDCSICINCDARICAFSCYDGKPCCLKPRQPPLSMTCRVLRKECLGMFYGGNMFHIRNWGVRNVLDWSLMIGTVNLRHVKVLHVSTHSSRESLEEDLKGTLEKGGRYLPLRSEGLQLDVGGLITRRPYPISPVLYGATYAVRVSWAQE